MDESEQVMEAESGERFRAFTEKGRMYDFQQLSEHFEKLQKHSGHLLGLIESKTSFEVIKSGYSTWMSEFELYLEKHNIHLKRLAQQEVEEYMTVFEERDKYIVSFKSSIEKYFTSVKKESELGYKETVQNRTRANSIVSGHSSVFSSLSSKRLKEEQKRVELETKLLAHKKKKELEIAKLKMQLEEEELELSTNLAVSDAKSKVLDKFELLNIRQIEDGSTRGTLGPVIPNTHLLSNLNPAAAPFQMDNVRQTLAPVPEVESNEESKVNSQASHVHADKEPGSENAIHSVVQHLRKPPPEIKKFSGNAMDYCKFLRQFKAKVCSNTNDYDERMSYLEQYTSGEANKVVSGFSHLEGKTAYTAAMAQLEERYGDKDVIASAYMKKALAWPNIKTGDGKSLDEFALFPVECENAMGNIGAECILEFSENIRTLVSKLPFYMHDRWRSVVLKTKSSGLLVKFAQFVKFVKEEAKKINDPTYGNEALGTWKPKNQESKNSTKGDKRPEKLSHSGVVRDVKFVKDASKCTYCGSTLHGLADCKDILSLQVQGRCDHVRKNGLCFGCLKKGHLSKDCKRRITCAICNRKHPTILHDESRSVTQLKSEDKDSTMVGKSGTSVNGQVELVGQVGAGDVSCAMAIIPVKVKLKNKPKCIETYAFFDSGSSVSFCTEDVMHQLGGNGKRMQVTLNTMGTPHKMNTYLLHNLQVCDMD